MLTRGLRKVSLVLAEPTARACHVPSAVLVLQIETRTASPCSKEAHTEKSCKQRSSIYKLQKRQGW